jgi:8-oxoguanine deaminase
MTMTDGGLPGGPPPIRRVLDAGVLNDPITGLMQCGPAWAWHTIVGGRFVVRDGEPVTVDVARALEHHRRASERVQRGD